MAPALANNDRISISQSINEKQSSMAQQQNAQQQNAQQKSGKKFSKEDFEFISKLGTGAFSTVSI